VTTRALISGAEPLAGTVASALRQAGVEVVVTEDVRRVGEAVAGLDPGSVDTYVQLPVSLASRGDTVAARVRQFLSEGLLVRFEAVESVLPVLAPGARVLLVSGTTPLDAGDLPDDRRARLALLEVLAHAVRADGSASRVRVSTVSSGRGADELAAVALGREQAEPAAVADLQAREPEMSYEDWRTEVLGLATVEV
jgi:hypothetical protein